jgi:hypothetical protein
MELPLIWPILKPVIVTVNWPVVIVAPAVVHITLEVVGILHVPVKPAILLLDAAIVGCADVANKSAQYVNVMVPPGGNAFVAAKLSVTGTPTFVAIRSDSAMVKLVNVTWL